MADRRLTTFSRNQAGAVAPTYAVALTALVAIAGVGFDYSRMASLDTELQNAADQAALAGASQLDGNAAAGADPGACARATGAVRNFVVNSSRFANDGIAPAVTFQNETGCDATGNIRFWQDKEKVTAATSAANARYVEVIVDARGALYALTPVVGALASSPMVAAAMAGLGSSVCKVPPIMICSPDPTQPFSADAKKGWGVVATGHSAGNSNNKNGAGGTGSNNTWAPGDFGFLQINDTSDNASRNAKLLKALAYVNPPTDCTPIDGNKVSTGNPQGLYDAINTRFDIYDFNNNANGNVLASCQGTDCPAAPNVVKDMINSKPGSSCKIKQGNGNNGGWELPAVNKELKPVTKAGSTNATAFDDNGAIDWMGLPRDNCHYTSYNGTGLCSGGGSGRFGNGVWDRSDYFSVNHKSGATVDYPPNWQNITRYETYLWELDNAKIPVLNGANGQRGAPICFSGSPPGGRERRVMTVAIVSNCASLNGSSQPVVIDEFADVFLVEPSIDDALRYNAFKDAIYMEVIGKSKIAGNSTYSTQQVRRDVPYLIR